MKVLYVGNTSDDDSSPSYSTENHVKQALRNLGHEIQPVLERGLDWATIPGHARGADLFLWTRTAGFDPADLNTQRDALETLQIPTVGFHLDRWVGLGRESDVLRSPFFTVDYLFTADGGHDDFWKKNSINHVWSPPAVLSDECKRVGNRRAEFDFDVGFVGNLRRYGHPEWGPYRQALYRFLAMRYRGRFHVWEGGIRGQDLADLYTSVKVLIGDSCLAGLSTFYWSDRIPETLGRGGFLIHPETEGLRESYATLPLYPVGDFDRLGELVDYYLETADERMDIAEYQRGYVAQFHTYEARLKRILSMVFG